MKNSTESESNNILGDGSSQIFDAVLIDDDPLVHEMWQLSAARNKKKICCFTTVDGLLEKISEHSRQTVIYIDSNLGNNIQGENIAREMYLMGFRNIYLTTGYEPSQFSHLTFLRGIVGKGPPW